MSCPNCPCPDICLVRPDFCAWAAKVPQNPIEIQHICARSRMAHGMDANPATATSPSIQDQAKSLARSFYNWAVSGFNMASDEEVARRRAICAACPKWIQDRARCSLCGCFTEAKIRLKTEHCPDKPPKW